MKKSKVITLRVTDEEKEQVENLSSKHGCSVTAFLLECALTKEAQPRIHPNLANALCKLNLYLETLEDSKIREDLRGLGVSIWRS